MLTARHSAIALQRTTAGGTARIEGLTASMAADATGAGRSDELAVGDDLDEGWPIVSQGL
jgi:hypothetical protein